MSNQSPYNVVCVSVESIIRSSLRKGGVFVVGVVGGKARGGVWLGSATCAYFLLTEWLLSWFWLRSMTCLLGSLPERLLESSINAHYIKYLV